MLPDPLQTHSVYSLTTGGVSHSSVKTTQGETDGGISSQVAVGSCSHSSQCTALTSSSETIWETALLKHECIFSQKREVGVPKSNY